MNKELDNEIKEIDRIIINVKRTLQFSPERRFVELFNKDEINKLLDYITNLQEKYERMKENAESTEWESKCYKYQDIINEIRKIVKYEKEELDKFKGVDLLINTYQQVFGVMLEMLELKEGK